MIDPYLAVKWLHILSSTVLFGTGIGTAFQMVWAVRGDRAEVVHAVTRGVVVADWCFTVPAGIAQPVTGVALVLLAGWSPWEPWLVLSYLGYGIALACWLPVVHLQIRIRDLTAETTGRVSPAARRLYRIWFALGWPAFLALVGVFWLMVAKPAPW